MIERDAVAILEYRVRQAALLALALAMDLDDDPQKAARRLREIIADLIGPYQKAPIPGPLRHKVFERDGYRCSSCGDARGGLAADHVIPEILGGRNSKTYRLSASAAIASRE
jgi:hypothetical protein